MSRAAEAARAIVVRLGGERHAVPAGLVEEVVDRPALSPLPRLERHVAGLLRYRDAWIPAVDPMPLIGVAGRSTAGVALIVRRGATRVAILADDVGGIVELHDAPDAAGEGGAAAAESAADLHDADGPIGMLLPDTLFGATLSAGKESVMQETRSGGDKAVVAFRIGDADLAVPVAQVVEVAPLQEMRDLAAPAAGSAVGVVRRADRAVPVLDLRPEVQRDARGSAGALLLLRAGDRLFAVIADRVSDVVDVAAEDVSPLPAYLAGAAAAFVTGLARRDERLLALVDAAALLAPEEWERIDALDLTPAEGGATAAP